MNITTAERNEAIDKLYEAKQRGECSLSIIQLSGTAYGLAVAYHTVLDKTINPDHSAAAYEARISELEAALATSRALCDTFRETVP